MIALFDPPETERADAVLSAIAMAREAQSAWSQRNIRERAKIIGDLRPLLAQEAGNLARIAGEIGNRPAAEKMVSEVLPLLDACRFLQRNAARILRSKHFGASGRPLWLHGSSFSVQRKPYGVILIVGPRNYPLFIPAVQALHALVTGNAVVIKPAEATGKLLATFLNSVLAHSAIPFGLVHLLPENPEAARHAVLGGIDKAIFTGSTANGRAFLTELAKKNIPSIMELSGADTVFVRADTDVERAAKAIAFGLRLNGGDTCMAPHLVIAHERVAAELERTLQGLQATSIEVISVADDTQALALAGLDQQGLGASVFSRDENAARAFADRLTTGFVTINDLIVPTADPRFPFCGIRGSGFGVTRGAEGLLEMTYPQSISLRRTKFLPHLDEPRSGDSEIFAGFIGLSHGRGFRARLQAVRALWRAARKR